VRIGALARLRVGMHQGRGQAGQRVQQVVLGVDGDGVGGDGGDGAADGDLAFGPELVADPAEPNLADVMRAGIRLLAGQPQPAFGLRRALLLSCGMPKHGFEEGCQP
jgi:hypothetical protein